MIRFHDVSKTHTGKGQRKLILDGSNALFETEGNYALMGPNGSGKSSVMRLISGADRPNSGQVERDEQVSWPLGFHGGFNGTMTGRENVIFVARIYGQDPEQVLAETAEFAEIGKAMAAPLSTYSTGMRQRLAFGLSLAMRFDRILIDEIVAVGDTRFRKRCMDALEERLEASRVIVISHTLATIRKYCQRGMLLLDGTLYEYDDVEALIRDYRAFCA